MCSMVGAARAGPPLDSCVYAFIFPLYRGHPNKGELVAHHGNTTLDLVFCLEFCHHVGVGIRLCTTSQKTSQKRNADTTCCPTWKAREGNQTFESPRCEDCKERTLITPHEHGSGFATCEHGDNTHYSTCRRCDAKSRAEENRRTKNSATQD